MKKFVLTMEERYKGWAGGVECPQELSVTAQTYELIVPTSIERIEEPVRETLSKKSSHLNVYVCTGLGSTRNYGGTER